MSEVRFQAAIRSLSGGELAELIGALGRDAEGNSITGELLGLCLAEAVGRLKEPRIKNQEA